MIIGESSGNYYNRPLRKTVETGGWKGFFIHDSVNLGEEDKPCDLVTIPPDFKKNSQKGETPNVGAPETHGLSKLSMTAVFGIVGMILGSAIAEGATMGKRIEPPPEEKDLGRALEVSAATEGEKIAKSESSASAKKKAPKMTIKKFKQMQAASKKARASFRGEVPSRTKINGLLEKAAKKHNIPPNILKAVAWQESMWLANAVSKDGHDKGIMQIRDNCHPFAKTSDVWNAEKNINYGAGHLKWTYQSTGSWTKALKLYNGGSEYAKTIMGHAKRQPWLNFLAEEKDL